MKKIYLILMVMFFLPLVSSLNIEVNLTSPINNSISNTQLFISTLNLLNNLNATNQYDNLLNGAVDQTKWSNSTALAIQCVTGENLLGMYAGNCSGVGTGTASLSSVNLTSLALLNSLNFKVGYVFFDSDGAMNSRTEFGGVDLDMFVNTAGSQNVTYFLTRRNSTAFDVYKNGTYNKTITPTTNVLKIQTDKTAATGARSFIEMYYINQNNQTINSNLTNATLYIWNSTGLQIQNTNNLTGNFTNTTSWTISSLQTGRYKWNVYGCGTNETQANCGFYNENYTFDYGLLINSITYNLTTLSGNVEYFIANVTTGGGDTISTASLWWNGVEYPFASINQNGNNYIITQSISIPNTFGVKNWSYAFNFLSGSQINSSNYTQVVNAINLTDCSSGSGATYPYLNFTAYDEQYRSRINTFTFDATFTLLYATGQPYRNITISNSTADEVKICLSPSNVNYIIDADIKYGQQTNQTYNYRSYYYRNATLTNVTSNVNLFLLNQSVATSFILSVLDETQEPVKDALIYSLRYYEGNNTYQIVQVGITDGNGQTIGFFETEVVEYKFIIVKNNNVLLSTEKAKIFPQTSPFTLEFVVGSSYTNIFAPYSNISNLVYNLNFNETTNIFTYTFIDTSGSSHYSRLLVKQINLNANPTTICDTSLSSASGIITCNATGYEGQFVAEAYISRSPEALVNIINVIISSAKQVFGISGLILGAVIIGAVALISSFSLSVMLISVNATMIILNVVGLYSLSPLVIFSILGGSIILLVLLRE